MLVFTYCCSVAGSCKDYYLYSFFYGIAFPISWKLAAFLRSNKYYTCVLKHYKIYIR